MTTARTFLVVKDGNAPDEIEDAAEAAAERGRYAISDGASTSGFSKLWSRLLVNHFVLHTEAGIRNWSKWLPEVQAKWLAELKHVDIPWFGEEQYARGAFATFLSMIVSDQEHDVVRYQAEVVGDSCLFHVRGERLIRVFPIERSEDFDSFPKLVGSRCQAMEIEEKRSVSIEGTINSGDQIVLMSDALAEWTLTEHEAHRPPWRELDGLIRAGCTNDQFEGWIAELRARRELRNDDVVCMVITF